MSPEKKPHSGALDEPIEDPKLIRTCMEALSATETEFPIKVEGASTMPYSSVVIILEHAKGQFILKLVRPLPHELLSGALFRMLFAVEDQRYEGLIVFRGREAYLQYRFDMPKTLQYSDRRRHKRHPFRPREKTYMTGQDGGFPGMGIAGPLTNLSIGGCAIRLDRVLRMNDGMRIPANTGLFDKGKIFAKLRIQDLLKIPVLDIRGQVAHLTDKGDGIILGLSFGELGAAEQKLIGDTLTLREKMFRTTGAAAPRTEPAPTPASRSNRVKEPPAEPSLAPEPDSLSVHPDPGPLLLLQRHTARILVVTTPNHEQEQIRSLLLRHGFHRLQFSSGLEEAARAAQTGPPVLRPQALVVDFRLGETAEVSEPMALLREVQRCLESVKSVPLFGLCQNVEPSLALEQSPAIRFGTWTPPDEAGWAASLDDLLELEERESVMAEGSDLDHASLGAHAE